MTSGTQQQQQQLGACPRRLELWIADHGPYLFHTTRPGLAHTLWQHGVQPVDNHDTYLTCPSLRPRPGHVYLGDWHVATNAPGYNIWSRTLAVDVRRLAPANLRPDEDIFHADRNHPFSDIMPAVTTHQQPGSWVPRHDLTTAAGRVYHSWGDWAEGEHIGDADMTDYALRSTMDWTTQKQLPAASVAHQGPIPAAALVPLVEALREQPPRQKNHTNRTLADNVAVYAARQAEPAPWLTA